MARPAPDTQKRTVPGLRFARGVHMNREWSRGYFCAVAVLLREAGCVTPEVRSLYEQGGHPEHADADDAALFLQHGLKTPND
jgi:hypothetical protein